MTAHRFSYDAGQVDALNDPGTGNSFAINGRSLVRIEMISVGASETRTLPIPSSAGQIVTLIHAVDGGDIDLTVTSGFDEGGDTSMNTTTAGDFVTFISTATAASTYRWRVLGFEGFTGITEVQSGNQTIDGTLAVTGATTLSSTLAVTGAASFAGITDLNGSIMAVEAGAGITDGTGTIYRSGAVKIGGIIHTKILIDLTGVSSATTDLDIIGTGASAAHIGQITAAVSGTILGGRMTCLELPSSLTDIDLYSATVGTGVFEGLVTDLTETALLTKGGAWTAGDADDLTGVPPANDFLYLVNGAADTADVFTAGKFLIELEGYDA